MAAARRGPLGNPALARALLMAANLPADDLEASAVQLIGAWLGDELVGVVGLERHGRDGLLRSLVVRPDSRGEGLGGSLLDALEAQAAAAGIERLWLLTETAEVFFAARGYAVVARTAAPTAIAASREFAGLCPASATCMTLPLGPDTA
ncbi:MAG: arsenic resistance N-acetyltransferase ArsN2 [Gammaproteobacteria bacterium]